MAAYDGDERSVAGMASRNTPDMGKSATSSTKCRVQVATPEVLRRLSATRSPLRRSLTDRKYREQVTGGNQRAVWTIRLERFRIKLTEDFFNQCPPADNSWCFSNKPAGSGYSGNANRLDHQFPDGAPG